MREIKFRGYSVDKGEWVYGCLVNNLWTYSELSRDPVFGTSVCEIITGKYKDDCDCWDDIAQDEENAIVTVVPKSVGQFTGLKDKNVKEIYEGDIIELENEDGEMIKVVCEWGINRRKMQSGILVDIPSFYFKNIKHDFNSYPIVDNYADKHDLELFEVIGNIYEHSKQLI